jgi:hypothetical protein
MGRAITIMSTRHISFNANELRIKRAFSCVLIVFVSAGRPQPDDLPGRLSRGTGGIGMPGLRSPGECRYLIPQEKTLLGTLDKGFLSGKKSPKYF